MACRIVRDRSVLKAFVTGKFISSQKKHKLIMKLWSRMKLFLKKTGIQGLGISADLSLQSTILPGTLARMASFRCWCAWEQGTSASQPTVYSSQPWRWCWNPYVVQGVGDWLIPGVLGQVRPWRAS